MDAETGSCEHQQIPSRTQKCSVLIGSELDPVNRPLDSQIEMEPIVIDWAKEEAKMARIVRKIHV